MSALKNHYSQFTSEYLLERRALGNELSDEAHGAIERILEERGERLPPRTEAARPGSSSGSPLARRLRAATRRVTRFLLTPSPPLWRYCVIAGPLALVPSMVMLTLAMALLRLVGVEPRLPAHPPMTPLWVLVMVVATPLLETALLACGLWVLNRLIRSPLRLAAVSAVLWGLLHAATAPIWFFGTAWSFFVFSSAYITWRRRSRTRAFIAAAVPHGLVNLVAVAMMRAGM